MGKSGPTAFDRLQKLFMIRMNEGYFAEVQDQEDGSYLFIQKHCPIIEAATVSSGICRNELDLFQSVLGDNVVIERVEYLLSGASRCAYRITENGLRYTRKYLPNHGKMNCVATEFFFSL